MLLKPATLTLPRPAASASDQVVAFAFNGDGEGFHLVPHVESAGTVSLQVWHFSGAGVLSVRLDELEAVLGYEPTLRHEQAEQLIAAALADVSAPFAVTQKRIELVLAFWYDSSVRQGLDVVVTGPLGFFELAFGEWQAWLAYTGPYITNPLPASLAGQQSQASGVALLAARAQALRLLERCTTANALVALRNVIRLANAVNLAGLPIESASVPSGEDLATACMHVEIGSIQHATTLARDRDNRLSVEARVVFYEGPASTSIPLHYRLEDATNGIPVPVTSETTSTGNWQTTLRPTALGERRYDLTVELAAAATDDVLKALSARNSRTIPVGERLELFADTIGAVAPGSTVTLRILLAGDNINAIPITLTHDGPGSLPHGDDQLERRGDRHLHSSREHSDRTRHRNRHRQRHHHRGRRRDHHARADHRHRAPPSASSRREKRSGSRRRSPGRPTSE